MTVDVVVSATNNEYLEGGGVSGAIRLAANDELYEECEKLSRCETGEAKITKGCGLPAKYIIHTVGPVYGLEDGKEAELLAKCYNNSLNLAKEHGLKTIAFPAIATGAFRYPKEAAAQIALDTVQRFVDANPKAFNEIIFVLFDKQNFKIYDHFISIDRPPYSVSVVTLQG